MGAPIIDLDRPRVAHEIFSQTLVLYVRRFALFAALAVVVVVPVDFVLFGVVRGELVSGYRSGEPLWFGVVEGVFRNLWVTALISAVHVRAVEALGSGEEPRVTEVVRRELRELPAVAWALLLFTLAVIAGSVALILPGIYIVVVWTFAAQAVVIEGRRGGAALKASRALVRGKWWRTFWMIALIYAAATGLETGISLPLRGLARTADSGVVQLVGVTLADLVSLSFTALVSAVFYFAWRARAREPQERRPVRPDDPFDFRGYLPPEAPRP